MKKISLFLSLFFAFSFFSVSYSSSIGTETSIIILPGSFYFSINGGLQDGVNLSGLMPATNTTYQVGYWNLNKNSDYLYFYDSSSVPGFRIQMYLDGDFVYSGVHADQADVPFLNFNVFADWDSINSEGVNPSIGVDDSSKTLNINGFNSCLPSGGVLYSDYYDFHTDFLLAPFSKSFELNAFDYLVSNNSCKNEGKIYIGRFQLDLGIVKAGEYRSSLYIIMLDGY